MSQKARISAAVFASASVCALLSICACLCRRKCCAANRQARYRSVRGTARVASYASDEDDSEGSDEGAALNGGPYSRAKARFDDRRHRRPTRARGARVVTLDETGMDSEDGYQAEADGEEKINF